MDKKKYLNLVYKLFIIIFHIDGFIYDFNVIDAQTWLRRGGSKYSQVAGLYTRRF